MNWGALFWGVFLTAIVYMAFPLIKLSMNGGKFEKRQAGKIALWNSVVIGSIFLILTPILYPGEIWRASPALLYYWINRAILTKKEESKEDAEGTSTAISRSATSPAFTITTPISTESAVDDKYSSYKNDRIVPDEIKSHTTEIGSISSGVNVDCSVALKRVFIFIEDGEYGRANEYIERVLDQDPENAYAYLAKLLIELNLHSKEELANCASSFENSNNYKRILRYGDEVLTTEIEGYVKYINDRNETARLEALYQKANSTFIAADNELAYKNAAALFEPIRHYRDSAELMEECLERAENARKDAVLCAAATTSRKNTVADLYSAINMLESITGWKNADALKETYQNRVLEMRELQRTDRNNSTLAAGKAHMRLGTVTGYNTAIGLFTLIKDWKDANEQITVCQRKIKELKAQEEEDLLERECKAELARKKAERIAKRNKKIAIITLIACAIITFLIIVWNTVILPNQKYSDARMLMNAEKYAEAISIFETLDGYKDSEDILAELKRDANTISRELYLAGNAAEAANILSGFGIKDPGYGKVASGDYKGAVNSGMSRIVFPNDVISIPYRALYNCSKVVSITIPESVISIGGEAFYNCILLDSITIPGNVKSVGPKAFFACKGLKNVNIENGVETLGYRSFHTCVVLTSITIPNSVTSIRAETFFNCISLTSIYFSGTTAQWRNIYKEANWDANTGDYIVYCTDGTVSK